VFTKSKIPNERNGWLNRERPEKLKMWKIYTFTLADGGLADQPMPQKVA
jgi:hypothetical protein